MLGSLVSISPPLSFFYVSFICSSLHLYFNAENVSDRPPQKASLYADDRLVSVTVHRHAKKTETAEETDTAVHSHLQEAGLRGSYPSALRRNVHTAVLMLFTP